MLVMSRKANESIVLNHQITVTVVDIRGDKVRLGIQAPREASVHRGEFYQALNSDSDDPYRTVAPIAGVQQEPAAELRTNSRQAESTDLRIDPDRPLDSLKGHLSTLLGQTHFEKIRPLLEQLTEIRGIGVR